MNKAWEILGNEKSRDEYDNYLKLKSKLDSPRESMILVFIIIYALAVFVVYQYRKQRNYQIKLMLLKDDKVKRYFKDIGINITDTKQKIIKKKDKKSKKKSKNKCVKKNEFYRVLSCGFIINIIINIIISCCCTR